MLFSKRAAKIGRGPSMCCRCVWNSNNLILRYNDNGKQGITLREWWQRQLLQPIFMEDVALTTFSIRCPPRHLHRGSLLLSLHKGIKLKSNIAGNSFYFFSPSPGSEKWGKWNKNLDWNWYVSLKKMMLTLDTAQESLFEYRAVLHLLCFI